MKIDKCLAGNLGKLSQFAESLIGLLDLLVQLPRLCLDAQALDGFKAVNRCGKKESEPGCE
ncbi:hypothetical protein [Cupriavidus basilensis]|uniref:hypothetical protein n=1 Tax=Cupriavidus basilensis TaxID=68895 RepID=UPI001184C7D3|nr:hypothetical protein [Cupriavidus basilensis]